MNVDRRINVRLKYFGRTSSAKDSGSFTRNAVPDAHHSMPFPMESNSCNDMANNFCGNDALGDSHDSSYELILTVSNNLVCVGNERYDTSSKSSKNMVSSDVDVNQMGR